MSRIERLAARRRIALMVAASGFLAWQVPLMDSFARLTDGAGDAPDAVGVRTLVSIAGFAVWIVALLILVGPWRPFTSRKDAAMLNDELTRANRGKAFFAGYLAMMAAMEGFKRGFGSVNPAVRVLRNLGLNWVNQAGWLRDWFARQAVS